MKIYKIILMFFFTVCLNNCENKEEIISELFVSTRLIELNADVDTTSFFLNVNTSWNISFPKNYCCYETEHTTNCYDFTSNMWSTLNLYSGKKSTNQVIQIYVTKNPTYYRRWFDLTVSANGLSEKIDICQLGKPYLKIEQNLYELTAEHHFVDIMLEIYDGFFEFQSNVDWVSGYGYSLLSHIKGITLWYKVNCVVEENITNVAREGSITFTQGNLSKTITVKQAGKE